MQSGIITLAMTMLREQSFRAYCRQILCSQRKPKNSIRKVWQWGSVISIVSDDVPLGTSSIDDVPLGTS